MMPASRLNEFLSFIQRCRQRFFHKHVNAGTKEFTGDDVMAGRGHRDDHRIGQLQKRPIVGERAAAEPAGYGLGVLDIHICDTDKLNLHYELHSSFDRHNTANVQF